MLYNTLGGFCGQFWNAQCLIFCASSRHSNLCSVTTMRVIFMYMFESKYSYIVKAAFLKLANIVNGECGLYNAHVVILFIIILFFVDTSGASELYLWWWETWSCYLVGKARDWKAGWLWHTRIYQSDFKVHWSFLLSNIIVL